MKLKRETFLKPALQVRLTGAQIGAIRRKRQQGMTPRQIQEDTGIDHVTVWRHTRDIRPDAEAMQNEARNIGQGPVAPLSAPIPATTAPFLNGPYQTGAPAYQYAQPASPLQSTGVQTLQPPSQIRNPIPVEYVVVRTVAKQRHEDWYKRLQEDEDRYWAHDLRRRLIEARIAEYEGVTRSIRREMEVKAMAERQECESRQTTQASSILNDLFRTIALMVNSGMDPREAARKFGEAVDMCLLLSLMNR